MTPTTFTILLIVNTIAHTGGPVPVRAPVTMTTLQVDGYAACVRTRDELRTSLQALYGDAYEVRASCISGN